MEPFRAIVDREVVDFVADGEILDQLSCFVRQFILEPLTASQTFVGEKHNLFEISIRTASSLINVFEGKAQVLTLSEV